MSHRGAMCQQPPERCDFCGQFEECRPYGPNGENLCFDCAMKDEETTKRRFAQHVHGEDFDA